MGNLPHLLILGLLLACSLSMLVAPIDHLTHQTRTMRHNLAAPIHHSLRIRHNMRVLRQSTQHLSTHHPQHLAAIHEEEYGVNDMGYYMTLNITVGGVFYRPNLDTGSSDFWVKGQDTPKNPQVKYKCSQCVDKCPHYSLGYMDGYVSTYLLEKERVTLGNHSFDAPVLVAYEVGQNFEIPEGIIGLSFPQIARSPKATFIQNLIDNKIIDNYSFGININFQHHGRSFISFGQPDPEKYHGELTYYKLHENSMSYRIFEVKGVSIGKNPNLSVHSALLDTGNSCITLPSRYQQDIVNQFTSEDKTNLCKFDNQPFAKQFWLLRCIVRDFDKLPVLHITLGQTTFNITKDGYLQRCVIDGDGVINLCDTYIEILDGGWDMLLGDGFFTSVYSYFDLTNRRIGLAENRETLDYRRMYVDHSDFDDEDREFFADFKKQMPDS